MLDSMPYLRESGWSWHVAALGTTMVLIAWAVLAAAPALSLPRANLRLGLADGGFATTGKMCRRAGAKLVVVELATTMVLLAGAGLLAKSFYNLLHVNIGFVSTHLATLQLAAPESKYSNPEQAIALQRDIVGRLRSLAGVIGVGAASALPVSGDPLTQIGFVGRPSLGENNPVGHREIGVGYLSTLDARSLRGRTFNETDNANERQVAIINGTLAKWYFPGENPIGKQFFYHAHGSEPKAEGPRFPIVIVGVIADVKEDALDQSAMPFV
jgi:macrolide transport system ATP-binding/permease protein